MCELRRVNVSRWLGVALILLPVSFPPTLVLAQGMPPLAQPSAERSDPNEEITSRWPQDRAPHTSGSAASDIPEGIGTPSSVPRGIPNQTLRAQVPPQPQAQPMLATPPQAEPQSAPAATRMSQSPRKKFRGASARGARQVAKPKMPRSMAPAHGQRSSYAAARAGKAATRASAKPAAARSAKTPSMKAPVNASRAAGRGKTQRPLVLAPPIVRSARGQL